MKKPAAYFTLAGLTLDRELNLPLHRQLYTGLRQLILSGQLGAATRLPPTRELARQLGLSRSTVVEAIQQLMAEGYVVGRRGAGTFVSDDLPELLGAGAVLPSTDRERGSKKAPMLSARGRRMSGGGQEQANRPVAFQPGLPEISTFPFNVWRKLMSRHWREPAIGALAYGDPAGFYPLREAIVQYLRTTRGVRCSIEQLIITSGTQQALNLAAHLLAERGDKIWLEDPGYGGARSAFETAGLEIVPVPVDEQGISVSYGVESAPDARLAYVSPSHQYPLGRIMSVARRMQLLHWAEANEAWLLEDDYDSEYRFAGHPLAAMQSLDRSGRILYLGTFSKVLFPGLRLGYIIVPPELAEAFAAGKWQLDRGSPLITQLVLNDFMREGHFARHVYRMRSLYARRQAVLSTALATHCGEWLEVEMAPAGLHLIGWLPHGVDDRAVSRHFGAHGIETPALSSYAAAGRLERGGLLLGYGAVDEAMINSTVAKMARIWRNFTTRAAGP